MKLRFLLTLCCTLSLVHSGTANGVPSPFSLPDVAQLFVEMPSDRSPLLEEAWRKDLVALYKNGKDARLQNRLKGFSHLKTLTADYIFLQLTETATLEFKLLAFADTTAILCILTTVNAPVPDSRIDFFTPAWTPLPPDSFFTSPLLSSFLLSDSIPPYLDISLIHYRLSPDATSLTASLTTPLYLSDEQQKALTSFIAPPKTYIWDGFRFR